MNKFILGLFLITNFCSINAFAQNDSLDIFRTPSKSNGGGKAKSVGGYNSLSVSLSHLGRGGSIITYERLINNTPIAIFVGYGFTKIDYIGQFSFENEEFYFSNDYTEKKEAELNAAFDLGLKYTFDEELGGNYIGFCYSSYENGITTQVDNDYDITITSQRSHKLNYSSKDFKLIYGSMGESDRRFYSDFSIGAGLRFVDYQILDVTEVPVNINNGYYSYDLEYEVTKKSYNEVKPWLFIGWKIGLRF
jgi:hypothetical protein